MLRASRPLAPARSILDFGLWAPTLDFLFHFEIGREIPHWEPKRSSDLMDAERCCHGRDQSGALSFIDDRQHLES
jgi:hypothetical protein